MTARHDRRAMMHSRALVLAAVTGLALSSAACVETDPSPGERSPADTAPGAVTDAPAGTITVADDDGAVVAPDQTSTSIAGAFDVTWAAVDAEPRVPSGLLPLQMYFVERYLADVADKTPADLAFAAILDGSPDTRDFFVGVLESYRAMPDDVKYQRFDPEAVTALAAYTEPLELSTFLQLVDPIGALTDLAFDVPFAPTDLVAVNASQPGSMEQDPTGGGSQVGQDASYRVILTWRDHAVNETGFHIYRWPSTAQVAAVPVLVATVGPDTQVFADVLTEPATVDDTVCYRVVAYLDTPLDADAPFAESEPTETVCVDYHWTRVDTGVDTRDFDGDGLFNSHDECPELHDNGDVTGPRGCPDADGDGWPDDGTDRCPAEAGDPGYGSGRTPFEAAAGCPNRFGVNWMGLEAINNSISFEYGINNITSPTGKWQYLSMNEVDDHEGEEPYLLFEWVNGGSEEVGQETGRAQWCCGEGIDVAAGSVYEPDGTTLAEGDQDLDRLVRERGLVVFPPGEISRDPGLVITAILMEMDWTAMVRPESADTAGDLLQAAGEAALIISGCISSAGIGCLVDIGVEIVEGFLEIFGAGPALVEVDDPDDVMGDAVWAVTHRDALSSTADDGAYGFSFVTPNPNAVACLDGATPCPIEIAVPSRLMVEVRMCLYREGVPADRLVELCEPYEPVIPWTTWP